MKKIKITLIILVLVILSAKSSAQNKTGFEIRGKLAGLKDGTHLCLIRNNGKGGVDTVSSAVSKNEMFLFKGMVPIEAVPHFIKIDTTNYHGRIKGRAQILLDNSKIKLNGSIDDLSILKIKIEGSESHKDFFEYYSLSDSLLSISNGWLDSLSLAIRNRQTELAKLYQAKYDEEHQKFKPIMTAWIFQHPNSYVTPWLIDQLYRGDLDNIRKYYEGLTAKAKNSHFGEELKTQLDGLERTTLGKDAPNFEFPDHQGKMLSLKSVVSNSRVTLLDFWASWCQPCLEKIPEMKELYDEFHSKGFNIISYSVDEKDSSWKKSIAQNNISWFNVRETVRSFAENLYAISVLPDTYLIDSNGKIVAKGIFGKELKHKIEEFIIK